MPACRHGGADGEGFRATQADRVNDKFQPIEKTGGGGLAAREFKRQQASPDGRLHRLVAATAALPGARTGATGGESMGQGAHLRLPG